MQPQTKISISSRLRYLIVTCIPFIFSSCYSSSETGLNMTEGEWSTPYIYFYVVTILALSLDILGRFDSYETKTFKIDDHEITYDTGRISSVGSAEKGRYNATVVFMLGIVLIPILFLGRHTYEYIEVARPNALIILIIIALFLVVVYCIFSIVGPFFNSYGRIFLEKFRWVCYSILLIDVLVGLWHMDI